MTPEEAIDVLQEKISPCVAGKWKEAVDVAISALQAQDVPEINVGDMVSRRAAIDALIDEFKRVPTTAIRAKTVLTVYHPHSQKPVKDVSTWVNGRMKLNMDIRLRAHGAKEG